MFFKLAFLLVLGVAIRNVYALDGGILAYRGEFPYQASIRINGKHVCGGTIGSNIHIITGARCVYGEVSAPYTNLTVVTGVLELTSGGQTHNVSNVRVHDLYENSEKWGWRHDAAIITLQEPMKFDRYQKSIPLAKGKLVENALCVHIGWGRTRFGCTHYLSNQLRKAVVFLVSNDKCKYNHRLMPLYDTHICAKRDDGGASFHGDSGGPLVHNGQLVGITSWGGPFAMNVPDVFTKVSEYQEFFSEVRDV